MPIKGIKGEMGMLPLGEFIGRSKWDLDTPCLVVDEDLLDQNIQTMQAYLASFDKQLRPHAKTHKCTRVARKQVQAGCAGICVAKISEAEVLVREGFRGVLITSPVVTGGKIDRLMDCLSLDSGLMIVVDNPANARTLNEAAKRRGLNLSVLIDLDPGMGRTGVSFREGLALGQKVHSLSSLRLRGVQCYAGHVQHIPSFEERQKASVLWLNQAAGVFRQFRENGLPCDIFTGSGTGTYDIDCQVAELTDLQAGSYTLMDSEYLNIGSSRNPLKFEKFPPALTLLTTVISTNHPDFFTVDAGLKALYHHGGTPSISHPEGFGLKYEWWGDEHGRVTLSSGRKKFEIGEVLELVVSHCDPTVNLFDIFYVTRKGVVADVWPIDMRGKCQ
jgi:D-serine deaminase-like pyridoxal phosphate-dependent protein